MTAVRVILQGVVGSQAYGLATPESDVDRLGVFVHPTRRILSMDRGEATIVTASPDRTLHEVRKFLDLATACNPTILELLWLDSYEVETVEGTALLGLRLSVLSEKARATYAGYAYSQIDRLRRRGDGSFSADTRKRTEKHARHVARLLIQGKHLNATGTLKVRLSPEDADYCREMGALAADDPGKFADRMSPVVEAVRVMDTCLPREPDIKWIDEVLYAIRMEN